MLQANARPSESRQAARTQETALLFAQLADADRARRTELLPTF